MRLIDADEMASDESTAYMKAQIKTDRLTAMINEVVHKKIQMLIADTPTIDAVPVVHAHWIGIEYDGYANGNIVYDRFECSNCGNEIDTEDPPDYCCDCGAKMDGEQK